MSKGASAMVSSVIVVLISVAGISSVLFFGLPALEHSRASASFGEAQRNMLTIDGAIRSAASEGSGNVKEVAVQVGEGSYRLSGSLVEYRADAPAGFLQGSSAVDGGHVRLNMTYSNISLSGDVRLGQGPQRVCLRNAGQNGTHVLLNATSC